MARGASLPTSEESMARGRSDASTPPVGNRTSKADLMLQALGLFAHDFSVEMSIRDVARRLDTNPGTVHRAMSTLVEHEFLTIVGDRYHLGPACEAMAVALQGSEPHLLAQRHLEDLRDKTGETCAVTDLFDGIKVVTAQAESGASLRMTLALGRPLPVAGSVSDRLFLAFEGPGAITLPDPVPEPLRLTEERLAELRATGWDHSEGTIAIGALVVGVAFHSREGRTRVLSVFGPESRMVANGPEYYAGLALETARKLELLARARTGAG